MRGLLMSPRYAGLRGYASEPDHGRRAFDELWPAQWDGLVEEGTWRAVVALLSDPDRYRRRGARALLTGIAFCGVCGATVHAGGANTRQSRIYRCSAGYNGHVSRSAVPVEDWVSEVAIARLSRPDAIELLHDDNRPDLEVLRREATVLRARLDEIAAEFADGVLTSSQLQNDHIQSPVLTGRCRGSDGRQRPRRRPR